MIKTDEQVAHLAQRIIIRQPSNRQRVKGQGRANDQRALVYT